MACRRVDPEVSQTLGAGGGGGEGRDEKEGRLASAKGCKRR